MWAAIFNIWADEPVYHSVRHTPHGRFTGCGRKIGTGKPLMPMKHATKFARYCKSCSQEES